MNDEATAQNTPDAQQASQAPTLAPAQVGPDSEQMGKNQASQRPSKFNVPEDVRPALEALAAEHAEWEIRSACANIRRRNAQQAGDAEVAIVEHRNTINCVKARDLASAKLEAAVHEVLPEIPTGTDIHLEIPAWVVHVGYKG